jgi:hypothetical protein
MHKREWPSLLILVLVAGCAGHITDTGSPDPLAVSVLTQHNDNTRAGWNDRETVLTTSNVNVAHFGALFSLAVDDQVYAQPLVVANVVIGGSNGYRNVVYVATVNNTVYAFDGDNGRLYWRRNFTAPGMRPPHATDMTGACGGNYINFSGNIGIVGTPVIDSASRIIYFVARSTSGGGLYVQDLRAVDLVTGVDVAGSPVRITAAVAGTGDGSQGGVVTFNAQTANQRQGLTLVNGVVYVTFSSHCDWGPYHGWILGYDAATLRRRIVYNDTPNGAAGGIWESGMGIAVDAQGALLVVTGNGTVGDSVPFDPTTPTNRGESALKLTPSGATLQIASYFTPSNFQNLNDADLDYGTMGSLLIPNSSFFLTATKEGILYLLDKDNMGGWAPANQAHQVYPLIGSANMHCQPAYYGGATKEFVYVWAENDLLRAIPFARGGNLLDQAGEIDGNPGPGGQSGAMLSVSSNGSSPGTGILWAAYPYSGDAENVVTPGILRAFDATDVTKELWNNRQFLSRDGSGTYAKFASLTIANGHVYLPTFSGKVVVYGLQ